MFVRKAEKKAARTERPSGSVVVLRYSLTALFSALPAENFGTRAAGMCTFWDGLRGLTPSRAARCDVENLPNPVKVTASPP